MRQQRDRSIVFAERVFVLLVALLFFAATARAQVAPGVFTTVKSTSTAATSICVGCPTGSTTPAANSGITAATMVLPSGVPSSTTNKLYSSAGALFFNGLALATGGSINGTTNTIGKFTAATVIGDSIITDNGTTVTIAGAVQSNSTLRSGTNGAAGSLTINGPSATDRDMAYLTSGVVRWQVTANSTAESGANAGTNFRIESYTDAGSFIGNAVAITRSSMDVTLGAALTVTGASALSGGATAGTSFQLTGAAPVYMANTNNGYLFRNAANGATLFGITDAGVGTFTGAYTHTGVTTFTAQPIMSSLTASLPVFTDGSKGLVSNAMTGTGSVVMSAGPTLTGTLTAATFTQSGTTRLGTASTTAGWGVNAAGDWTFGATNIADSSGTPVITSGFGVSPAIAGRDYAFDISWGSGGASTGGVVTFGHTWTTAPVCVARAHNPNGATLGDVYGTSTTTTYTITYASVDVQGNIAVICRSY